MCKEMFLYTSGLKEWAVWNWMLWKKSKNQLYSHTSPHYDFPDFSIENMFIFAPALSAPKHFPDFSIENMFIFAPWNDQCDHKVKLERRNLSYEDWEIHRNKKEQAQIANSTVKELPLCEYLLVTTLDLQTVLLSIISNLASLCNETKLCCHIFTIYDPPPPPPFTHIQLNTTFGMKTMGDLRQMNLPPVCNIT